MKEPIIEKTHKGNRTLVFVQGWFHLVDGLVQVLSLGRLLGMVNYSALFQWEWYERLQEKAEETR